MHTSLTDLIIEMRFLLVHDSARSPEAIKNFFMDVYELFIKVHHIDFGYPVMY